MIDQTVTFKIMTTHCRNVIFSRRQPVPPTPAPLPPGPVEQLNVVTPNTANSGSATATFLSPAGSMPGTLDYNLTLTGGPGIITIVSITPVV